MNDLSRTVIAVAITCGYGVSQPRDRVEKYAIYESAFTGTGRYENAYTSVDADAVISRPDGSSWSLPLFWDGGTTWKLRLSPDLPGKWSFRIESNDPGLNGQTGGFDCTESGRRGGLIPSKDHPSHFARQNGEAVWFLGDTAWGYFHDSADNKHHKPQAEQYAKARASQGFNAIHCMLLSEAGDGNNNGPPWTDLASEKINPGYWKEVDARLLFANRQGLTVGMAIAWGDKRKQEPFAWRRFPSLDARKRYARYIAARYGAYDVYFLLSGEWHAEIRTRGNVTAENIFREFVEIGSALDAAEPHGRMIGIHPMTEQGSVREFTVAPWMSFADYQQNYDDLHGRVLMSRYLRGPVVNSEYGYLFRDSDGDGKPDKSNSFTTEDMRFASWDIVMAGGYLVTGFGTTYFAGHRDPGPFDLDAAKNDEWEAQIGHIKKLFTGVEYWRLIPADAALVSEAVRGRERTVRIGEGSREAVIPPHTTYWALADPGKAYLVYVRGTRLPVTVNTAATAGKYTIRQYNPRTGEFKSLAGPVTGTFSYTPPDEHDWVVVLQADRKSF